MRNFWCTCWMLFLSLTLCLFRVSRFERWVRGSLKSSQYHGRERRTSATETDGLKSCLSRPVLSGGRKKCCGAPDVRKLCTRCQVRFTKMLSEMGMLNAVMNETPVASQKRESKHSRHVRMFFGIYSTASLHSTLSKCRPFMCMYMFCYFCIACRSSCFVYVFSAPLVCAMTPLLCCRRCRTYRRGENGERDERQREVQLRHVVQATQQTAVSRPTRRW